MAGSDIVVIGAGPSGMAAVSALRARGLSPVWVDRTGEAGGAYRSIYPGTELSSPRRYTSLPGLDVDSGGEYVSAGEYRAYLDKLGRTIGEGPEKEEVAKIVRREGGFVVRFASGRDRFFRRVVVATGMFDFPKEDAPAGLGGPGGPSVSHSKHWKGPGEHRGDRLLIVGAGTSGVELAEECAKAGVPVAVSARRGDAKLVPQRAFGRDVHAIAVWVERLPLFLFRRFCDAGQVVPASDLGFSRFRSEGRVSVKPEVERFEGRTAVFRDGSREDFDAVVLATGFRFDTPFLPDSVKRAPAGHPRARGGESVDWPGLHFIGFPCSRALDSQYLRGMKKDAEALARRLA
ncbi:MAG: NAD(P)/FAD-dependent oxidoreductase [Elusimicrobia bacterium]|nr:NAD(P)/FAD-dependent oxidoreductase [Elusimicrobiota bacterium]